VSAEDPLLDIRIQFSPFSEVARGSSVHGSLRINRIERSIRSEGINDFADIGISKDSQKVARPTQGRKLEVSVWHLKLSASSSMAVLTQWFSYRKKTVSDRSLATAGRRRSSATFKPITGWRSTRPNCSTCCMCRRSLSGAGSV